MLKHILTTVAMILLPYLIYGIYEFISRRRRNAEIVSVNETSYWRKAPVLVLGLIGCVLAVAVLIGTAVIDSQHVPYDPPIERGTPVVPNEQP